MKFLLMCLLSLPVLAASVVSNGVSVNKQTPESVSVVLGTKDALSVSVCKDSGLVLNFDDFINVHSDSKSIMRVIVTDNEQFEYKEFASSQGLFLKYSPKKM